jgi:hypothetical protein
MKVLAHKVIRVKKIWAVIYPSNKQHEIEISNDLTWSHSCECWTFLHHLSTWMLILPCFGSQFILQSSITQLVVSEKEKNSKWVVVAISLCSWKPLAYTSGFHSSKWGVITVCGSLLSLKAVIGNSYLKVLLASLQGWSYSSKQSHTKPPYVSLVCYERHKLNENEI